MPEIISKKLTVHYELGTTEDNSLELSCGTNENDTLNLSIVTPDHTHTIRFTDFKELESIISDFRRNFNNLKRSK